MRSLSTIDFYKEMIYNRQMNFIPKNKGKIAVSALFSGLIGLVPLVAYADTPTLSFSIFPQNITAGETATLTWFAENVSNCTLSGIPEGGFPLPASWTYSVNPTVTTSYTLVCSGTEGFVQSAQTLSVGGRNAPSPTVYNTSYPNYTNQAYLPYPNYNYYPAPNYNLTPVSVPTAPTPTNFFTAACAVSPSSVAETNNIGSFGAAQSGGVSPFIYRWTGNITGSQQVENIAFEHTGVKTAKITVTDSRGLSAEGSCSLTVTEPASPPAEKPATPVTAVTAKKPAATVVQTTASNCKTVTVCMDTSGNVTQKDGDTGSGAASPPPKDENKIETAQNGNGEKTFFLASLFGSGSAGNGSGSSKNFLIYLLPIIAAAGVIFIGYMVMRFTKKA